MMNFLKNIFARAWAFWGLVTFTISFFIIFLPSMISHLISDPRGQYYFIKVSKLWMNCWLLLIGCPVKVTGKEHFVPGKSYVIVFNHNALLDVPLSAPYVPGPNKTIAKLSFARIPVFGLFYRKGSVLVDRKNERSRVKSFEEMKKVLASGMHMCIYPEGTRNRSSAAMKQFYDGAFSLAIAANKDIIPCVIIGTKKAMPINKTFYLLPTRLKMHFLPPVSAQNIQVKELKDQVFNVMSAYYLENV